MISRKFLIPALLLPILLAGHAQALISWSQPSGSTAHFQWSGGGSDTGLFGSPVLVDNTFHFTPAMRAESLGGFPAIASDRIEFELHAVGGGTIHGLTTTHCGSYGTLGGGDGDVIGALYLTNLVTLEVIRADLRVSNANGQWSAYAHIDGLNWQHVKLVLDINLLAVSDPDSVYYVQQILGDIDVCATPEPTTAALITLGLLILRRRRPSNV